MSTTELCGFIQTNGTACQCKATFSIAGTTKKYCGRHKDKAQSLSPSLKTIPQTTPASTTSATTGTSISSLINMRLTKENRSTKNPNALFLYNSILDAINDANSTHIDENSKAIINSLDNIDNPCVFNLIISGAVSSSGATATNCDPIEVAKKIPEKYHGFKKAENLSSSLTPTTFISFYPKREGTRTFSIPQFMYSISNHSHFKSSCFFYEKANVKILNCKYLNPILLFGKIEDLKISDEEKNILQEFRKYQPIYIGKPLTIEDRFGKFSGVSTNFEKTGYFIPRDLSIPTREEQNARDTERILLEIKNGENPEKYLSLKGRTLCCNCLPEPCHCEVFVSVIEKL